MRKPIVAGNWKMHGTVREAQALAAQVRGACETDGVDVVLCPPFTALSTVAAALQGSSIGLGAQDLFWEAQGAFTGEVAPPMLRDAGCRFVIIGHSERRTLFGETDAAVQRKVQAALAHSLTPILCIGEMLAQRDADQTFDVLARQLEGGLAGRSAAEVQRLVLAYEPVWAIGTGRNATPAQAQEAHEFIRQQLAKRWGRDAAQAVRLQYGGSVTAANAAGLLAQPDVDGALVGGASLNADAFAAIVKAAETKAVTK
ncbi:MAG: triose-phosphate isomerase [Candidatus Omnitrophica bacterium]|nr:triose-phosphate isomerase [Candidatus Omnitrophota bacterium]